MTTQPADLPETLKSQTNVIRINAVWWTIAWIFAIVGTATAIYHIHGTDVSAWEACSGGSCTSIDSDSVPCSAEYSMFQAIRAFQVLSIFATFVVSVMLIMIAINKGIIVSKFIVLVMMGVSLVFLALAWILEAGLFTTAYCGGDAASSSGGMLVTSFGFFLTTFIVCVLMMILYYLRG